MNSNQELWKKALEKYLRRKCILNYFGNQYHHTFNLFESFNFVISFKATTYPRHQKLQHTYWKESQTEYILRLQKSEEIETLLCLLSFGASPTTLLTGQIRMVSNLGELSLLRNLICKEQTLGYPKFNTWLQSNHNKLRNLFTSYWQHPPVHQENIHTHPNPSEVIPHPYSIYTRWYITDHCTPGKIIPFMKDFLPCSKKILRIQT